MLIFPFSLSCWLKILLIQWVKPRPYTSKNPLILRTNYACHMYLIACVTLQSFAKNISLSRITTAAPSPLLPSCYCNYFLLYHHYHTTLLPTIIIHQNCTAPLHCYLNLKTTYNITITLFLLFKIYVQWHICLYACYAKKLWHKKGKKLVVVSNLSVKFTCTFNNFLLLGLGLYFLVSS